MHDKIGIKTSENLQCFDNVFKLTIEPKWALIVITHKIWKEQYDMSYNVECKARDVIVRIDRG